jgi:hypothetical protein
VYIQSYGAGSNIDVADACGRVPDRTCEVVALILDEAEKVRAGRQACLGGGMTTGLIPQE